MDAAGQPIARTFGDTSAAPPPKKLISVGSKRKNVQKQGTGKRFVKASTPTKSFTIKKKQIVLRNTGSGKGMANPTAQGRGGKLGGQGMHNPAFSGGRGRGRGRGGGRVRGGGGRGGGGRGEGDRSGIGLSRPGIGLSRPGIGLGRGRGGSQGGRRGGSRGGVSLSSGRGGMGLSLGSRGGNRGGGGGGGGGGMFADSFSREGHGDLGRGGGRGGTPGLSQFHPRNLSFLERKEEIDPSEMVYPGHCKLFFGGLPEDCDESRVREMLEPFGEPTNVYVPEGKQFAIITMDSREKAYKAMVCLNGINYEGKWLRVRPSPDAAVWVGDLPSVCTNELLKVAFSRFGPVLRGTVHCDTRGRSHGSGVVEFLRKGSATSCVEACTAQPFILTKTPHPVRVEPLEYCESDAGLPAKDMSTDRRYFEAMHAECTGQGPRLASTSEPIAMEWLKLYQTQQLAKQSLKERFVQERKELLMKTRDSLVSAFRDQQRYAEESRAQHLEIMQREQYLSNQRNNAFEEQRGFHNMLVQEERDLQLRQQSVLAQQKAIEAKLKRLQAKQNGRKALSIQLRGRKMGGW